MCIKINKSANRKQESDGSKNASHDMGTYMKLVTKYIRFLPSTVAEKNATKNILDGRKDGQR
jgi:hypothetical protein